MKDKHRHFQLCGAGIHTINEFRKGAQKTQGVLLDVVRVRLCLFEVLELPGHLHILLWRNGCHGNSGQRQRGGGHLHQRDLPRLDIVVETDDGRGEHQPVAWRLALRRGVERVGGD